MPAAESIPTDLLSLLRCPLSGQTLAWADPAQIARARERLTAVESSNEALPKALALSMTEDLTAALVRADGSVLYPVRDGIPVLLPDAAITL